MVILSTLRSSALSILLAFPLVGVLMLTTAPATWAQDTLIEEISGDESNEDLNPIMADPRPLAQDGTLLSLPAGEQLLEQGDQSLAAGNPTLAVTQLREARQVFNQLSNFYQQLSTSFSGLDNRIADRNRQLALQSAELRDQASYKLAIAHQAEGKPDLAMPLLIQVIRSQQPTRPLGQQAYQALLGAQPMTAEGTLLSVGGGEGLMSQAQAAVAEQNYELAATRLREARQVFNQLSNFHQQLADSFTGIDNDVSQSNREIARQSAQLRDQSTYQLALVHRAQNKPDLAVPLLVQIVQSQQPTRELGQQAYQQLFELGFVDFAYPGSNFTGSSSR